MQQVVGGNKKEAAPPAAVGPHEEDGKPQLAGEALSFHKPGN